MTRVRTFKKVGRNSKRKTLSKRGGNYKRKTLIKRGSNSKRRSNSKRIKLYRGGAPKETFTQGQLAQMKLSQLRRLATRRGASEDELDNAGDDNNPNEAFINLILDLQNRQAAEQLGPDPGLLPAGAEGAAKPGDTPQPAPFLEPQPAPSLEPQPAGHDVAGHDVSKKPSPLLQPVPEHQPGESSLVSITKENTQKYFTDMAKAIVGYKEDHYLFAFNDESGNLRPSPALELIQGLAKKYTFNEYTLRNIAEYLEEDLLNLHTYIVTNCADAYQKDAHWTVTVVRNFYDIVTNNGNVTGIDPGVVRYIIMPIAHYMHRNLGMDDPPPDQVIGLKTESKRHVESKGEGVFESGSKGDFESEFGSEEEDFPEHGFGSEEEDFPELGFGSEEEDFPEHGFGSGDFSEGPFSGKSPERKVASRRHPSRRDPSRRDPSGDFSEGPFSGKSPERKVASRRHPSRRDPSRRDPSRRDPLESEDTSELFRGIEDLLHGIFESGRNKDYVQREICGMIDNIALRHDAS